MLTVIINKASKNDYSLFSDEGKIVNLINDIFLFKIFNGEENFLNKKYNFTEIENLIDDIVSFYEDNNVILHTFNPLVLNYFTDEVAVKTFYFKNKNNEFEKFFDDKEKMNKLDMMGPGEVVSYYFQCF